MLSGFYFHFVCKSVNGLYVAATKQGSKYFNDIFNTFKVCLYGVGHMVNNYIDSEIGNALQPFHLCTPPPPPPDIVIYTTTFVTPDVV